MWYVIHRGFREKLRRIFSSTKLVQDLVKTLTSTLQSKLAIFGLNMGCQEAIEYKKYTSLVVDFIKKEASTDIKSLFMYNYPEFIERVNSNLGCNTTYKVIGHS